LSTARIDEKNTRNRRIPSGKIFASAITTSFQKHFDVSKKYFDELFNENTFAYCPNELNRKIKNICFFSNLFTLFICLFFIYICPE
jgi:hypothetical protein